MNMLGTIKPSTDVDGHMLGIILPSIKMFGSIMPTATICLVQVQLGDVLLNLNSQNV